MNPLKELGGGTGPEVLLENIRRDTDGRREEGEAPGVTIWLRSGFCVSRSAVSAYHIILMTASTMLIIGRETDFLICVKTMC